MHESLIAGGIVRKLWLGETQLYRQHLLRLDPEERGWQGRGAGTALLKRVLLAARNRQIKRLHMICLAGNPRMQQLALKFDAELGFQSGSVVGEVKAPRPTTVSIMRELVADGTDLATAILDVPSQLAKRLEYVNDPPRAGVRDRQYERPMLVDNWR